MCASIKLEPKYTKKLERKLLGKWLRYLKNLQYPTVFKGNLTVELLSNCNLDLFPQPQLLKRNDDYGHNKSFDRLTEKMLDHNDEAHILLRQHWS